MTKKIKKKFEKKDPYEVITNRIIEIMEKGNVPWKKTWQGGSNLPANLVSFRKDKTTYSGLNVFTLSSMGYSSRFWLTFKQGQDLGGMVKKGEKGFPVVYFNLLEKDKKNNEGKTIKDANGENVKTKIPLLRYHTVFNTEQFTGIEVPELEVKEPIVFNPIESAEKIVKGYIGKPEIKHGGERACYSPMQDIVKMPPKECFVGEEEYYSTLFHELVHSTGHKNRLNREEIQNFHFFGDENYSKEELTAEMGATFLISEAGISTEATMKNSVAYLQNWINALRNDKTLIVRASTLAKKAVNKILGVKEKDYSKENESVKKKKLETVS